MNLYRRLNVTVTMGVCVTTKEIVIVLLDSLVLIVLEKGWVEVSIRVSSVLENVSYLVEKNLNNSLLI